MANSPRKNCRSSLTTLFVVILVLAAAGQMRVVEDAVQVRQKVDHVVVVLVAHLVDVRAVEVVKAASGLDVPNRALCPKP